MNQQKKADLMLVLCTSFWGISNSLASISLRELQPLTLNSFRFLSAFLVLGLVFFNRLRKINRETLRYGLITGIATAIVYIGAVYGVLYTSVSNAGFIGAMTVLFTPILEYALYRRKPEKKFTFSLLLCLVGIALLTLNETLRPALGDIICLLVPSFYAVDLIVTERAVAKPEVDAITLSVCKIAIIAVVMIGLALLFETPSLPQTPTVWASVLFLGVVCSGVCFIIQCVAQQYTTANHAGLIFTLEPVFSAGFAYFLLSEQLTAKGYFGAALMLVSLFVMEIDFSALRKKEKKEG